MKKKIFLLILTLFLLTGCSVQYNVDITDNQISIDGKLVETDPNRWEEIVIHNETDKEDHYMDPEYCKNGNCGMEDMDEEDTDLSDLRYSELVDLKTINFETKMEGLERLKTDTELGIIAKKEVTFSDKKGIKNLPGIKTCYKHFSVVNNLSNDGVIFSTSNKNLCFENYHNLDEIIIKLKTNHEVKEHNADEVKDGEYIWKINKINYDNKNIQINLLNKTKKKLDLSLLISLCSVILVVVIVVGIFVVNLSIKSKKANKIK